jgi:hypothetical protein
MKKLLCFLSVVMCMMFFSACDNKIAEEQTQVITLELQRIVQEELVFHHALCEDLAEQVKRQQAMQLKNAQNSVYKLSVQVPDAKAISKKNIEIPGISYTDETGPVEYKKEFLELVSKNIGDYIKAGKNLTYKKESIEVSLARADGEWKAKISSKDVLKQTKIYEQNVRKKANEILETSKDYVFLVVRDEMQNYFENKYRDVGYQSYITMENLTATADGYQTAVTFPEVETAYKEMCKQAFKSMEKSKKFFSEVYYSSVRREVDAFQKDVMGSVKEKRTEIAFLDIEEGKQALDEIYASIDAKKKEQINALVKKLNDEVIIKTQKIPKKSKTLLGGKDGEKWKVKNPEGKDIYIAFYKLEDNGEKTKTYAAYLKSDSEIEFLLPAGKYHYMEAYGENWFGEEYVFGPDGTYYEYDKEMEVKTGYEYYFDLAEATGDETMSGSSVPFPYS